MCRLGATGRKSIGCQGGLGIYIDAEHKLDLDYAKSVGVNTDDLLLHRPDLKASMRVIFKTIGVALGSVDVFELTPEKPLVVIIDSMNNLLTDKQLEADFESVKFGPQAREMSEHLPTLLRMIAGKPVALVFVSQWREKLGLFYTGKNKVACGNAPKFYNALTIELRRTETVKISGKKAGIDVKATIIKSSISKPFSECSLDIVWGHGFNQDKALFDLAADFGIIEKPKAGMYSATWKGKELKWGIRQLGWADKNPGFIKHLRSKINLEWKKRGKR